MKVFTSTNKQTGATDMVVGFPFGYHHNGVPEYKRVNIPAVEQIRKNAGEKYVWMLFENYCTLLG